MHLVNGSKPPDSPKQRGRDRIKAMPKPAGMIQCGRCGGREVTETRIGVEISAGKPKGGTRQLICTGCLMRGERVVVF